MPISGKRPKTDFTAIPQDLLSSALSGYAQLVYIKSISHDDKWIFTLDQMRNECSLMPGKPMSIGLLRSALCELRAWGLVSGKFNGRRRNQPNPLTFHREPFEDGASPLPRNPLLKDRVKKRAKPATAKK